MKPKAIYIDCTATAHLGLNTGIQRVVRNIVTRVDRLSRTAGVPCVPVMAISGKFWKIPDLTQFNEQKRRKDRFGALLEENLLRFIRVGRVVARAMLRNDWAYNGARRVWRGTHRALEWAMMMSLLLVAVSTGSRPVEPKRGDVLLMADAFWLYGVLDCAKAWAARGGCLIPLIYDLIPVTHPQYCHDEHARLFRSAILRLLEIANACLAISSTVMEDVKTYVARSGVRDGHDLPVGYFYLGADLGNECPKIAADLPMRQWPDVLWSDRPIYLMVGTIEPRKGHIFVLGAFERLWAQGSEARLCVVGLAGWKCEELIERFKTSRYKGTKLFVFHDVNDRELDYCYRRATALIFASSVEGFGLPLVEAMEQGIAVLASDIGVFREIGQEYPMYFSLESPDHLVAAVRAFETRQQRGHKTERRQWLSWDESTEMFIKEALRLYALQARESGT